MEIFNKYANYYDASYKEKDYAKEVDFLSLIIKRYSPVKVKNILSLGCGTASHDILLAQKGYRILGIDQSSKMLEIARRKAENKSVDIRFKKYDVTKFNVAEKFDFAMAMFNIVGYMTENEYMDKMPRNTSKSLKKSGLFVFDCWYGPAVLKSRPENKTRSIAENIFRRTTQKLDIGKSIIDITFEIIESEKLVDKENHKMRFWFLKELEYFFNKNGFKLVKICNFMDINSKISEDNWNIFVIAQKI